MMWNSIKTSETMSCKMESDRNLGLSKFISCSLLVAGVGSVAIAWVTRLVDVGSVAARDIYLSACA